VLLPGGCSSGAGSRWVTCAHVSLQRFLRVRGTGAELVLREDWSQRTLLKKNRSQRTLLVESYG
jgi:hypothetical protein